MKKNLSDEYSLETLAKGIIHEIRNPLNAIYAHVQLLEEEMEERGVTMPAKGAEDSDEGNIVPNSLMQIKIGLSQIDGILREFGRFVRQTKPVLKKENLNPLLNDVLRFVDAECRSGEIKIVKHFQEDLPEILLDANQIKQAVLNLILNANQAMPKGGTLTVTTALMRDAGDRRQNTGDRRQETGGGCVCVGTQQDESSLQPTAYSLQSSVMIEIQDTGIGISEEQRSRIFDLFYSTKPSGTGLGLPIVQKIVHDHAGKMEIISQPGRGTGVRIVLPVG